MIKVIEEEKVKLARGIATIRDNREQVRTQSQNQINKFDADEQKLSEQVSEIDALVNAAQNAQQAIAEKEAAVAERSATAALHAGCAGEKAALASQRDAHAATITTLQGEKAALNTLLDAANAQTESLTGLLNTANATIAQLRAQLGPQFKVYNEWKSKPDLSAEKMPPIRFIYENELIAPGETRTDPPNLAFLDDKFAQIKAQNLSVTRVVLDQEGWLPSPTGAIGDRLPYFIDLVSKAREFWDDVAVYMVPRRSYGFVTGTVQENNDRKAALLLEAQGQQALWDLVTFFSPSLYYLNPIHLNAVKRDEFIQFYYDLCNTLGPGKKIIPTLYPRIHTGVPQVELRGTWIGGDYFRATLDKVYDVGCSSVAIFGQSDDPDPVADNHDWLINGARPFIAARGLTL